MTQIEYTNKPSKPTLMAAIRKALNAGETFIYLAWGENWITIAKDQWGLFGTGWIGEIGGQDLANAFKMTT
ncbi:hypothetical protein UFOVP56_40 [uncultured Caudovirales phage]|uniref:Uncharacterized protein n=1 Tax=uncultured Caudovirales phage TaxID=2100421 RepID=A0A6J5TBU9_9CAUD|nr:hypothetical protein UFOVP56_40 [uncultured Caudovirales phage]